MIRERTGRALVALLGRHRFHKLVGLAQMMKLTRPGAAEIAAIHDAAERFHVVSYTAGALNDTYWFGVPIQKSPLDCWVYQELLHELRPDLVVETGTYLGGSALFFAHLLDLLGKGAVITVDRQRRADVTHPRVTQLIGDSTSDEILGRVRAAASGARCVLVALDSDHSAAHVLREMRAFAPLVTLGSYLVVEDTNVNGHPVMPEHGPGPLEAVREFLSSDDSFVGDRSREKFLVSYFPEGWLRRVR